MYNFLVTAQEGAWNSRSYTYPRERFCEYTAEHIKTRFASLTPKAVKDLTKIPTLFAYEGTDGDVRVGNIKRISDRGTSLYIEFDFDHSIQPIPFSKLEPLRLPLDIADRWEMSRTHWAIKDEDLLTILASANLISRSVPSRLEPRSFVNSVVEASIFVWPENSGLTASEITAVGAAFGYKGGELSDAVESSIRAGELVLDGDRLTPGQIAERFDSFTARDVEDLRNPDAFATVHQYMLELARERGIRAAVASRAELIADATGRGIDAIDTMAAIECLLLANHFEKEDRDSIRLVAGRERWTLPQDQMVGGTTYDRGAPRLRAIKNALESTIQRSAQTDDDSAARFGDAGESPSVEDPYDAASESGAFETLELDVREVPFTVSTVLQKIRKGQLILTPAFQRRQVWRIAQQSKFIESILLNYPLPPLFLNQDREGRYLVIDGLQRTSTLKHFSEGRFALQGLERLVTLNGLAWEKLPTELISRIEDRTLNCYVLKPTVPVRVINDIFARINTGGTQLNRQEIRHALYQGPATLLLDDLSSLPDFRDWIGNLLSPDRMGDVEVTLRCIAFARVDPETAYKDDMDEFLVRTMKDLNLTSEQERAAIAAQFATAWPNARTIFGDNAFRLSTPRTRGRINLAVMESVYRFLVTHSQHWLHANSAMLRRNYEQLLRDAEYLDAVRYATGDRNRVKARFRIARERLEANCAH